MGTPERNEDGSNSPVSRLNSSKRKTPYSTAEEVAALFGTKVDANGQIDHKSGLFMKPPAIAITEPRHS